MIWWAVPEDGGGRNHLPGRIEVESGSVFVGTGRGYVRLLDIEVAGARMKNDLIFNYFKSKKGLFLT
jgi:hypothetical protein